MMSLKIELWPLQRILPRYIKPVKVTNVFETNFLVRNIFAYFIYYVHFFAYYGRNLILQVGHTTNHIFTLSPI
jgi:hypothetical protein